MKATSVPAVYLLQLFVIAAISLSTATVASAAEWRSTKGVSVNTTYTDNRDLSDDNEKGEFSLGVTPSLGITGRGARLTLDFRYAPGLRFRQSGDTSVTQTGTASLNSELYEDVLFLDASVNARQSLKNSFGRSGGDDVNRDDNTTQSYTYSISPYTRHRFGSYADSTLRYTYDGVINTSSDTSSSTSQRVSYSIASGRRFPVMPWSLDALYSNVDYDDGGEDSKEYTVNGTVGYVLNRIWQLDFYGNYEKYDAALNETDDSNWGGGAGFTYTPSERTFLRLAYGYRIFGWNAYMDFSHRSKRSTWTASLTHDLQSSRDEQLAQQTFDENGNPIFNPDAPNLERGDEYYVIDRLQTSYTLNGKRNSLGISGYISERRYEISDEDQRNYGVSTRFNHSLSGKTSSNTFVSWDRSREDSDVDYDTTWTVGTGLTHQLGARTNLSLDVRHLRKDADSSDDDYTENRISLTLGRRW